MISLMLAILTVVGLIGIGVGLGEGNLLIITISAILALICTGVGFRLKNKKLEEEKAVTNSQ